MSETSQREALGMPAAGATAVHDLVNQDQTRARGASRRPRPKLAHLRSFLYLARLGSMTAAADELGISQPTMSDHIDQLERGFDDKLFTRSPTGVRLTATGEALCARVERSVSQLDNLTFDDLNDRVVLGGPTDMLRERVLPTLAPLLSAEGISIRVQPGIAEELLERLKNRTIDLFIAVRWLNTPDVKVEYLRLFQEEYVLVGNADWKRRIPMHATAEQVVEILSQAPFLAYDEDLPVIRDHPLIVAYEDAIFGESRLSRVRLIMPNFGALANVAIAGGGVTVLPLYIAAEAIKAKKLFILHTPELRVFNPVYVASRTERKSKAVESVISELRRRAPAWETPQARAAAATELPN